VRRHEVLAFENDHGMQNGQDVPSVAGTVPRARGREQHDHVPSHFRMLPPVPSPPDSRAYTAYTVDRVNYVWNRGMCGLKHMPSICQSIMAQIFADIPYITIYMDNIFIVTRGGYEAH
jgi:hypothetical protein